MIEDGCCSLNDDTSNRGIVEFLKGLCRPKSKENELILKFHSTKDIFPPKPEIGKNNIKNYLVITKSGMKNLKYTYSGFWIDENDELDEPLFWMEMPCEVYEDSTKNYLL